MTRKKETPADDTTVTASDTTGTSQEKEQQTPDDAVSAGTKPGVYQLASGATLIRN